MSIEELLIGPGSEGEGRLFGPPEKWQRFLEAHPSQRIVVVNLRVGEPGRTQISKIRFDRAIEFRDCHLGESFRFESCAFHKGAAFTRVVVTKNLTLSDVNADDRLTLDCECPEGLVIERGTFAAPVSFEKTGVLGALKIEGATFHKGAHIKKQSISGPLRLSGSLGNVSVDEFTSVKSIAAEHCKFERLKMRGLRCAEDAVFRGATFSVGVDFAASKFGDAFIFKNCQSPEANFAGTSFDAVADFSGGRFEGASFAMATFHGEARFDDRQFAGPASFQECKFFRAPSFFGAALHENYDFSTTRFYDIRSEWAEGTYRVLKRQMHEKQAYSDELNFFALELRSRGSKLRNVEGWLIRMYWTVCACGRGIVRPLLWAAAFFAVGVVLNALLVGNLAQCLVAPSQCSFDWSIFESLTTLTKVQAMPFLGVSKEEYSIALRALGIVGVPILLHAVGILNFLLVSGALFLALLGLRNLMRMKAT